jgi:hypothetical protein
MNVRPRAIPSRVPERHPVLLASTAVRVAPGAPRLGFPAARGTGKRAADDGEQRGGSVGCHTHTHTHIHTHSLSLCFTDVAAAAANLSRQSSAPAALQRDDDGFSR